MSTLPETMIHNRWFRENSTHQYYMQLSQYSVSVDTNTEDTSTALVEEKQRYNALFSSYKRLIDLGAKDPAVFNYLQNLLNNQLAIIETVDKRTLGNVLLATDPNPKRSKLGRPKKG